MDHAPAQPRRRHLGRLIRLATPLVASLLGAQAMGFVDTAMVGRLGAAVIGGVGIGNGIFLTLSILGMGLVLGMDPLVAQAVGAGEHARARRALWEGTRLATVASVPIMALLLASPAVLEPFGVAAETATATHEFLLGRLWGALPFILFAAVRSYLQAYGRTRPIVMSMVVANLANVVLDAVLIYGDGALAWVGLPGVGLPALGAFGAGLASTLSNVVSLAYLALATSAVEAPADPVRRRHDPATARAMIRLGLPVGLQMLVEVSAFATAAILSGRIGVVAAAGNQVALTLASATFMVPLGTSMATAVLVGHAVGADDTSGARRAGFVGFAAAAAFSLVAATVFIAAPEALSRILTDKPDVIAAAVPLIQIAALFQLCDGLQVVGAGALRGAGDTRSTLWANLVGHFAFGLPLAAYLAFSRDLGGRGLWWGLSAGLTIVAIALTARFAWIARRPIARVR